MFNFSPDEETKKERATAAINNTVPGFLINIIGWWLELSTTAPWEKKKHKTEVINQIVGKWKQLLQLFTN